MAALHSVIDTIVLVDIACLYIYYENFPADESRVLKKGIYLHRDAIWVSRGPKQYIAMCFPYCQTLFFSASWIIIGISEIFAGRIVH